MKENSKKYAILGIFSCILIAGFLFCILLYHQNTKFNPYEGNISKNNDNYNYEITEVSQYKNGYTIKGWGKPKDNAFHKFEKSIILWDEKENKKYRIPTAYNHNPEEENVKEIPLDTASFHATALNKYLKGDRNYRILLLDGDLLIDTGIDLNKNREGAQHEK